MKTVVIVLAVLGVAACLPVEPDTRIVGGTQAEDGSAPWMVSLNTGVLVTSFMCGGSLVSTTHVLTAAHCIAAAWSFGSLQNSLRANIGSNDWRGGTSVRLSGNITHPNYVSRDIKNDIGILIIRDRDELTLSDRIAIIPLNFEHIEGGVEVTVNGWGASRPSGSVPRQLQTLTKWTLGSEECAAEIDEFGAPFNPRPFIESHIELCTFHSEGHGTCHGDSGSALVLTSDQSQVGVVSWGFPCAIGAPDMYARVSGFQDFLEQALA